MKLTTSGLIVTSWAVPHTVTSLVLINASAVMTFIFRARLALGNGILQMKQMKVFLYDLQVWKLMLRDNCIHRRSQHSHELHRKLSRTRCTVHHRRTHRLGIGWLKINSSMITNAFCEYLNSNNFLITIVTIINKKIGSMQLLTIFSRCLWRRRFFSRSDRVTELFLLIRTINAIKSVITKKISVDALAVLTFPFASRTFL